MIASVPPPPAERKIHRDAMRYEIGVEFPSKEKEEIDFDRLKKQIANKVIALVNKEDITLTSVLSHQEAVPKPISVIASTRRVRGNLRIFNTL